MSAKVADEIGTLVSLRHRYGVCLGMDRVGRLIVRSQARAGEPAMTWTVPGGVTAGVAVMYLTGLLVAA